MTKPTKIADNNNGDLLTFLTDHPIYGAAFKAVCRNRSYGKGEIIINQGDLDDDLFILRSGRAKVVLYSEAGHEIWLAEFEPGTTFGEMACLLNAPRSSTIIALEDCQLDVIAAKDFKRLIEDYPEVWGFMTRLMASRLRDTTRSLFEGLSFSLPHRVYEALLREADGDPVQDEVFDISPPPNVTNFSGQLNVSREAVSRAISRLVKRGLVKKQPDHWQVVRPDFEFA